MILRTAAEVTTTIFQSLATPNLICVFPTETALRFWTHVYVRDSAHGVMRHDNVLAWDTFRARFLPVRKELPANSLIRHLFALQFLRDKKESTSLQWFRYPSFPESLENLASTIAQLVPHLDEIELMRTQRSQEYERMPGAYRSDVARLTVAYRKFMEERGLYEPRFLHPSSQSYAKEKGVRYRVFFPEVCKGWQEFSQMQPFPAWIETCSIDEPNTKSTLQLYPNELMELRAQLNKVQTLYNNGVDLNDIMITVGELERLRPYLKHEAALRNIPLSIVERVSPIAYPPGRFLQLIQAAYTHSFSLSSMKALLLDPQIPWKDPATHRALIKRGIELHIIQGSQNFGIDDWSRKLSQAHELEIELWYKDFKSKVLALVQAKSITGLLAALFNLQELLLEKNSWRQETLATDLNASIYAYCIEFFTSVGQAMTTCGIAEAKGLFAFVLQFLDKQNYIEKDRPPGIPVYGYTVSVGVCATHHFVLGCTQQATAMQDDFFPLLHESFWHAESEQDESAIMLAHYQVAGKQVYYSAAKILFGGDSALVPAWFIEKQGVEEQIFDGFGDMFSTEERAWIIPSKHNFRAQQQQSEWFKQAKTTAYTFPRYDLAEEKPMFSVWQRACRQKGEIKLSATAIDRFKECPMKWAATYLFGIQKGSYDAIVIDHAEIGIILHDVLAKFFRQIQSLSKVYNGEKGEQYREILATIGEQRFAQYAKSPAAPPATTMHYITTRYLAELEAIIQAEGKTFNEWSSENFETYLEHTYPEDSYLLTGRIDRIARYAISDEPSKVAVIDYKKSFVGSRKAYDEDMPSCQLPLYAKLIRDSTEFSVADIGAFYDISKGSYHLIWKEDEPERRDRMIGELEEIIKNMIEDLRIGKLGATPTTKACQFCDYRQICRRRYTLP